jgi:hypothetical protein
MVEVLEAKPDELQAASAVLRRHALQLNAPSQVPEPATEAASAAAVALSGEFDRFATLFGHRLSCVSAQLSRTAGVYTTMDTVNTDAVRVV